MLYSYVSLQSSQSGDIWLCAIAVLALVFYTAAPLQSPWDCGLNIQQFPCGVMHYCAVAVSSHGASYVLAYCSLSCVLSPFLDNSCGTNGRKFNNKVLEKGHITAAFE